MRAHLCAVVLVIGGLLGGVLVACSDEGDHASTAAVETVLDLQGTWSNEDTWSDRDTWHEGIRQYGPTTLTVTDCAAGEECAHLELIDDNLEHCVYELLYRSEDADSFTFKTGVGNSFGCAYSPWANSVMHLTPGADGTVEVVAGNVEQTTTTLRRAED